MGIFLSCLTQSPIDPQASYEAAIQERESNSPQSKSNRSTRSIGAHTKFWSPGRTLKIAITRWDDDMFNTVKNAINQWAPYVNLNFEFVDLSDNDELFEGDIRIDLSPHHNTVPFSRIGTDAIITPANEVTMGLGVNSTDANYSATVLHEFGHALGLVHEHQHPDADIPWDKEKVYEVLQRNYGMSRDAVDATLFPLPRDNNKTYTAYDRYSVMHYQVTNDATIGDWEQLQNMHLSEGDIAFARQIYPNA